VDAGIEILLQLGIPLVLLVLTYFTGGMVERRHFASIRRRESRFARIPAITFRKPPDSWEAVEGELMLGSVVISVDYFKRFLAGLRGLIGGRVKSYETLMDRARREALLRLKEQAIAGGFHAVINVRIETSRLANASRRGDGVAGLEVLAFGTGLKLRKRPA
jgi:uncharacterized protein YbjQ (UPF0145 family)